MNSSHKLRDFFLSSNLYLLWTITGICSFFFSFFKVDTPLCDFIVTIKIITVNTTKFCCLFKQRVICVSFSFVGCLAPDMVALRAFETSGTAYLSTKLKSQKTWIFSSTAVRTWNHAVASFSLHSGSLNLPK